MTRRKQVKDRMPGTCHRSRLRLSPHLVLFGDGIDSGIDVVLSIADIELPDCLRRGSQWFECLFSNIRKHQALIAAGGVLHKGHSAGVRQPAPLINDGTFLVRKSNDPGKRRRLRCIGMPYKSQDVLRAVEAQRLLDTVDVRPPAPGVDSEVTPVRRKPHCPSLHCIPCAHPFGTTKVCQTDLVGDTERPLALLCERNRRTYATQT